MDQNIDIFYVNVESSNIIKVDYKLKIDKQDKIIWY